jgi:hypothetical protein
MLHDVGAHVDNLAARGGPVGKSVWQWGQQRGRWSCKPLTCSGGAGRSGHLDGSVEHRAACHAGDAWDGTAWKASQRKCAAQSCRRAGPNELQAH